MSDRVKFQRTCPHSDCSGEIRIMEGLPTGDYDCICGACRIRLSWWKPRDGLRSWPILDVAESTA